MSAQATTRQEDTRKKVRVAVIWIDWYPYHLARFSGLLSVANANDVAGIELVGGVGVHKGLVFREERAPNLPVKTLMPNSDWQTVNKFSLSLALLRELSRLDPDVVLVPGYYTLPAFAAMGWTRVKRRTSVLMTETTATDHLRVRWKERIKSRLIRSMFDWAVTGGAAHVRYLLQLGFAKDRIAHFYDVVGNEQIRESTEALRTRSSAASHHLPENYFLFVGRLAEEKNVLGLVHAWLDYRKQGGTWSLVLAGDGPERGAVAEIIQASACRQEIHVLGHKSSRELIPLFAFARCFVLPSTREPWGLVVNEAMAASLPLIVSTRCGCAEDLVTHGENGLLFDPADQRALTRCLTETEQLSAAELQQRGLRSASKISAYSPGDFGQEVMRIWNWSRALRQPAAKAAPRRPRFAEKSAEHTEAGGQAR